MPRIETLFAVVFVRMAAMAAMAIIAMIIRVMILSTGMPVFTVSMEFMTLHVDSTMKITVGLVYHGIRKVGLGIAEQNRKEIAVRNGLRHQNRRQTNEYMGIHRRTHDRNTGAQQI